MHLLPAAKNKSTQVSKLFVLQSIHTYNMWHNKEASQPILSNPYSDESTGKIYCRNAEEQGGKHCLCLNTDNAFLQEGKKIPVLLTRKNTTMQPESKTISRYYQGKYVILNLTLTAHPRTFRGLMDLSFSNQGYKEFFPFK